MVTAANMGLLDSGEYVFINVDLFTSNLRRPWYSEEDNQAGNDVARAAFQHVLTISSSKSVNGNFNQFKQNVEAVAKKIFDNSSTEHFVNSFVGNYYDAVKIFSGALTALLPRTNRSLVTGDMLTRSIWNKTHHGVFGSLNIDHNGDRRIEFSLLDLKMDRLDFEVVQVYHGANNSFQVKQFSVDISRDLTWAIFTSGGGHDRLATRRHAQGCSQVRLPRRTVRDLRHLRDPAGAGAGAARPPPARLAAHLQALQGGGRHRLHDLEDRHGRGEGGQARRGAARPQGMTYSC